nr:putative metal-binding motif-containing protein [Myxococcales bacterium]
MTDIRAWGLVAWAAVAGGCAWYVTEADRRRAADRDGDGFASVRWGDGTDCDDDNPQIHPAAAELCGDNVDNNCDGATDDFGVGNVIWYSDADGDGFGLDEATGQACATHDFAGFTRQGGDCNDRADGIHPGADDSDCDGVDDDCSGVPDDTDLQHYLDADGDGFGDPASPVDACDGLPNTSVTNTDCDDTNAQVYPEALEICDGVDNSCNGKVDDEAAATVNASVNHASVGAAIEAALASNTPATVHVCAGDHTIETVSVRSLDDLTVVGAAGRDATTLRPPN